MTDHREILDSASAEVALWEPWKREHKTHPFPSVGKRPLMDKVAYKLDLFANNLDEWQKHNRKDEEVAKLAASLRRLAKRTRK